MGLRITLRLNDFKHKDIIDALQNHKNISEEIRRLLRKGIQLENGELAIISSTNKDIEYNRPFKDNIINKEVSDKDKEVSDEDIEALETSFAFIDFSADE